MTFKPAKWPRKLRSQEWFGGTSKDAIYHRSWMKNQGLPADLLDGRPVVGICNTWSELTPCNAHLRDLAEKVKFGIYEAGGFPVEFPVFSPAESSLRPTAMMYRNLCAMDVEEAIRGMSMDGARTPPQHRRRRGCQTPAPVLARTTPGGASSARRAAARIGHAGYATTTTTKPGAARWRGRRSSK